MGVPLVRSRIALAVFLTGAAMLGAGSVRAEQTAEPATELAPMDALDIQWPDLQAETGEAVPVEEGPAAEVAYRVLLAGLDEVGLDARFRALSSLEKSRTAENVAQLDRRAREDIATIEILLRAGGWYAGQASSEIRPGEGKAAPTTVTLTVEPGPRYTLTKVDVLTPPSAPRSLVLDTLRLRAKEPVDAAVILAGENRIRTQLPNRGYPFVAVGDREIVIDHDSRTAEYLVSVTPGPRTRFGTIQLDDAKLMGPRHVGSLARFKSGSLYDGRQIEDLRRALVATGLFSSVAIKPVLTGAELDGDQIVDIDVATLRAPPRTVTTQAGYSTGEGIRVEASWQHRALVKPEGALTVRSVVGTEEQRLAGELRFNNFRARDNVLLLRSEASHESRAAYTARSLTLGGALTRETNLIWQKLWTYSLGAEFVATDETDTDLARNLSRRRTFLIAAAPLTLGYDDSDDLLDPTRGFRLAGRLSPEASFQNSGFGYLRLQIDGSGYKSFARDKYVLAGRLRIGSIFGASRDRIAPSRRFYSGGGGSVRGFGFQDIGPKDAFDDPIGGRSLAEAAIELRARFGDFGIVPFVDGGQIFTGPLPRFDSFRVGAGIGVRYHTSFGPVRIDVGTPINRQRGEGRVAVSVALGQAF